ncbi:MAG TPA: signal peptidase I [Verrucomicrobiota bacterium]|nr:signal peptidase I [Verrucomicrobiota bacterium]
MANDAHELSWIRVVLIGRDPRVTLIRIAVIVVLVVLARAYVIAPIQVRGGSMLPTYQERGVNFVNRIAYLTSSPRRFDVVAIRFAGDHVMLMKRIIGMPGETIEFRHGRVYINGQELTEPHMDFENYPCDWEMPPRQLGPDEYYVVGDNRSGPRELHEAGVVRGERFVGRILLKKNLRWRR